MVCTDVFLRLKIDNENYTKSMRPAVIPSAGMEIDLMVALLETITRTTVWLLSEMDDSGLIITWSKRSEDVRIGTTNYGDKETITHLVTPVGTFNMVFDIPGGVRASALVMNGYIRDALQLIECETEKEDPRKLSFDDYQEYLNAMILSDDWDDCYEIREYVSVTHAKQLQLYHERRQKEGIIIPL